MRLSIFFFAVTLFAVGCQDGSDTTEGTDMPVEESTPMGTASIAGMISLDGEAPERTPVRMKPECMDEHESAPLSENVLASAEGRLKSVFVYVKEGLPEGYSFATPAEPVVLDQVGCMYTPRVLGVQTGQMIRIENSDPFQHNIHPVPEVNRGFNESTPNMGDYLEKEFLIPEVMISVKCDVHSWMQAYIGVLDHPYFAVSSEDGSFVIEGLPAGEYTLEAWHEEFGTQTMQVTVADGEAHTEGNFTFAAAQ